MVDKETRQAQMLAELAIKAAQPVPDFAAADPKDADQITVLLTTSFMPSHPSPWVVENVYNSLRRHLPTSRIVVLADGVNGTEHSDYTAFKQAAREKGWELIAFRGHHHQTLMMKTVLLTPGLVTTPLIIAGDGDWGYHQRYMDWRGIIATLLDDSNGVYHVQIRQDNIGIWELAMDCFGELQTFHGVDFLPTRNFQAPTHIARTDWYRNIVSSFTHPQLLERQDMADALFRTRGINQMAAYIPPGPIARIYHLNGQHVKSPEEMHGIGDL